MSATNEFNLRMQTIMVLGEGLGRLPLDESDYLDPFDDDVTYDQAAYLEDEIVADHLSTRLDALRILRFAKQRGFAQNRALVDAFERAVPPGEVNHAAIALADALFAVVSPDEIAEHLYIQAQIGALA